MKTSATLKYLIAVIIYGTIGYFLHYVNCESEFVVMCRGLLGSLFILLVMFVKNDLPDFKRIKDNLLMLIVSGVSLGLNWLFLFAGYRYAISTTSLCNYMAPMIVVVVSAVFLKEKLSVKQIVCILISLFGITLLSGLFDGQLVSDIHCFIYGLAAAIDFVVLVLCNKRIHNIKPLDKTVVQLFVSFLTVLPVVLIRNLIPTSLNDNSLVLLIIIGVLHTGVAYILYFNSIDILPVHKVAIIGYIEPVLNILIGTIVFNEKMTLYGYIGAILILSSALINELYKS